MQKRYKMFCPNCKTEYREGLTRCADCNVDLVAALPAEAEQSETDVDYIDLVNIKTYSNRHDAELERAFLSANDITAAISGDDCGGTRPALSFIRGVHLCVKKEDVERAKKLISDDSYSAHIKEGLDSIKKPVSSFLSKTFTWSFVFALGGLVGMVVAWVIAPEGKGMTPLMAVFLSLNIAAKLAWYITLGIIAHRLGRRWLVWTGVSFVLGPIGLLIVYLLMLGYIKVNQEQKGENYD